MQISTIGLDIAKNVFQVHGIDAAEKVVVRKRLRRRQVLEFFKALPPCLIGMEACATAHYWARELTKLGHRVRLMPAKDVKAYVGQLMQHRTRDVLTTPALNALRAHLAELRHRGAGDKGVKELLAIVAGQEDTRCRSMRERASAALA